MSNSRKRTSTHKLFLILSLGGFASLSIVGCFPTEDEKERDYNFDNAHRIEMGMDSLEVRKIFGPPGPGRRYVEGSTGIVFYNYPLPYAYESEVPGIQLQIGTGDGKVMSIYPDWLIDSLRNVRRNKLTRK